jgi:hypothetical protein
MRQIAMAAVKEKPLANLGASTVFQKISGVQTVVD